MEFNPIPIFIFFSLITLVASHAALQAEVYWNKMLPNTTMPIAIKDLLQSDESSGIGKLGKRTRDGVSQKGMSVSLMHKGWFYGYAATVDQLQTDPNRLLFFLQKDMHVARNMNLSFYKTANKATFLPPKLVKSMPFSPNNLAEIFHRFSVNPASTEAKIMKHTIKLCEDAVKLGEPETCATSLESMIDFTVSQLGKNVRAIVTEVGKETQMQKYTIIDEVKKVVSDKSVACHKLPYVYAVFYCHSPHATEAYSVPLLGADGSMINAVAVCHKDTSAWNPQNLAFQMLQVKPGTTPVCHFVLQDHIIWAP